MSRKIGILGESETKGKISFCPGVRLMSEKQKRNHIWKAKFFLSPVCRVRINDFELLTKHKGNPACECSRNMAREMQKILKGNTKPLSTFSGQDPKQQYVKHVSVLYIYIYIKKYMHVCIHRACIHKAIISRNG